MSPHWMLVTMAALAACNSGKPMASSGGGESGGGGGGATSIVTPKGTPDYSGKKLTAQTGSVDGLGFSIDVPEGLPREQRNTADWDTPDPSYDHAPKVFTSTIEIRRIQDLDQAKYHATLDARTKTWTRAESRPDSWALTMAEPDKSRIEAITYKQANDTHFIKCKAVQATTEGTLPNYDKTKTMLETICDSLKATGAASDQPTEKDDSAAKDSEPTERPAPTEGEGGGGRLERAAE